jgi:predicted TPR repeat methyltransferase
MSEPIRACRGCGSGDLHEILALGEQPPANALTATAEQVVPTAPLTLLLCGACALAQLAVSLDPSELFTDYAYFSGMSPGVVANAEALVRRVLHEVDLGVGSRVLEIASNDGYLLRGYRDAGVEVLGVDPARNIAEAAQKAGIPTLPRFFTAALGSELAADGWRADVVHANNVIAHVPALDDVVEGIAAVLAPRGTAIIETPSLRTLVEHLEYDTIYHEHVYCHSAVGLDTVLRRHGLTLVRIEQIPIHGGSLRLFVGHAGRADVDPSVDETLGAERAAGMDKVEHFADFGQRVDALRSRQRAFLDEAAERGRSVGGYGAAAKATVLLHAVGADVSDVAFVVDRSPHKVGRYLPNTGIPVLAVSELTARQPDYAMVFAWNFAEEIITQCADYAAAGGRFVIPVPDVAVH